MNNEKGFKVVSKTTLAGFIILGLIVVILVLLPVIIRSRGQNDALIEHVDDGAHEDNEDDEPIVVLFKNKYQLEYSIGKGVADKTFTNLGRSIAKTIQLSDELSGQLEAILVETSFKKVNVDEGYAYSFDVELSDEKKYQVYVRTDQTYGNDYYASLLLPFSSRVAYMDLTMVDDGEGIIERDSVVRNLSNWAKEMLPGTDIILNVIDV